MKGKKMELFDREMAARRTDFDAITPDRGLAITVKAAEWTFQQMGDIQTEGLRGFIEDCLSVARRDVADNHTQLSLPADMLDQLEEFDKVADEFGVTYILQLLLICSETHQGVTGGTLYDALSYCYEAVSDQINLAGEGYAAEEANGSCRDLVNFYGQLVTDSLT